MLRRIYSNQFKWPLNFWDQKLNVLSKPCLWFWIRFSLLLKWLCNHIIWMMLFVENGGYVWISLWVNLIELTMIKFLAQINVSHYPISISSKGSLWLVSIHRPLHRIWKQRLTRLKKIMQVFTQRFQIDCEGDEDCLIMRG